MEAFQQYSPNQWLSIFLKDTQFFGVDEQETSRMCHFLVTMLEQVWFARNKILKGETPPNWIDLSKSINVSHLRYWKRCKPKGRLNFDAAFYEGKSATSCIIWDEYENIFGAWVNHFRNDNAFCAESEAAIQALKIAKDLNLDKVIIEGDAMFVILAMHGMAEFADWKATKQIEEGKRRLRGRPNWYLIYSSRESNACAHQLAKWAFHSNFVGEVDKDNLSVVLDGCM